MAVDTKNADREDANTNGSDFFISSNELAEALKARSVKIVDGSWYLPAMNRDAKAEYEAARIPGAQYFDINAIADTSIDLPHMMPSPEVFSDAVGKMGISETDEIVVYDGVGVFSSARVWWTFRTMGAKNVKILAGGSDAWKAAGLEMETGAPKSVTPAVFNPNFRSDKVRDFSYMHANVRRGDTLVLDARPMGRFTGEAPEPREGLRSGHIPGSKPLPAMDLVSNGMLISKNALVEKLAVLGVDNSQHITTTCGSGVTAAILSLALETVGYENHSLYDGSWADWGAREDAPVARWE